MTQVKVQLTSKKIHIIFYMYFAQDAISMLLNLLIALRIHPQLGIGVSRLISYQGPADYHNTYNVMETTSQNKSGNGDGSLYVIVFFFLFEY